MRFPGFFLLLLLLAGCVARPNQSTTQHIGPSRVRSVSGYVLDATSCRPMAGVPVAKNGAQTVSAEDGFFRLNYPTTKQESWPEESDELGVYSLDYAGSAAIPPDTTQRVTLLLLRNAYRFPPHGLLHPADSVHALPCASPWLPGGRRALLIQDSSIHQPQKLRALSFSIGKNGFAREPIQVRIYQYNGPGQPPGEDLLTEDFIISAGTEGVFTYYLSNYDVVLPATGFFLGLEYTMGGDSYYINCPTEGYVPIGPVLRPPYAFADTRTWEYVNGKGWHRTTPAQNCWPRYESAISAEVEPLPPSPPAKH